jgi:hypothetical protein
MQDVSRTGRRVDTCTAEVAQRGPLVSFACGPPKYFSPSASWEEGENTSNSGRTSSAFMRCWVIERRNMRHLWKFPYGSTSTSVPVLAIVTSLRTAEAGSTLKPECVCFSGRYFIIHARCQYWQFRLVSEYLALQTAWQGTFADTLSLQLVFRVIVSPRFDKDFSLCSSLSRLLLSDYTLIYIFVTRYI